MEKKHFVEWQDELSVGIQEIDEQHKILIKLINRLYDEVTQASGGDKEHIDDIMHELVEYTVVHFAVEESLFRIFHYPGTEVHTQHHTDLRNQVSEIQKKIKEGSETVNIELLNFLKRWLNNHIMSEDKTYGPFLIKQGVKSTWEKKSWLSKIWHRS